MEWAKTAKRISEAKTLCCNARWYRKSRANFRCNECNKDVTLDIMFLYEALLYSNDLNKTRSDMNTRKKIENTTETKAMPYDTVLATGFGEDDYVEGIFLIVAKAEETFFNRKRKIEEITGFSDGFFESYEEDEDGGVWRVITTAWFENVDEIKKALKKMEKYNWLFLSDSSILFEGKEIYCGGRWLI